MLVVVEKPVPSILTEAPLILLVPLLLYTVPEMEPAPELVPPPVVSGFRLKFKVEVVLTSIFCVCVI